MFTSGLSSGAVAVLALFAGNAVASVSVQARQFTNGTTAIIPAVGSTLTVDGRVWQYDGCLGSRSSFSSFALQNSTANGTVESCLASCPTRFAGLYQGSCYCANIIDGASSVGSGVCNIPCPGNPLEACGGNVALTKRQASNAILLSLYESVSTISIVAPIVPVVIVPVIGSINVITYINVYFGFQGPVTVTQTLSYAHCGCTTSAPPTPPMTTTVSVCPTCAPGGGPATATLTVPCVATATGPAVYNNGVCSGAGCPVISSGVSVVTPVCVGASCPAAPTSPANGVTTVTVSACPAATPVVKCPGGAGCPATTGAAATTTPCPTCPGGAKFTGAASSNKVAGALMAVGIAAVLL